MLVLSCTWLLACSNQRETGQGDTAAAASTDEVIASTGTTVLTDKGTLEVPGTAFIDGRDIEATPPLTLMRINIWDAVQRRRAVCQIPHATFVDILDIRHSEAEQRYYFQVRSGRCQGWVSQPFLSAEQHQPVGDRM